MNKSKLSPEQISEYTRVAYYYYKIGLTQEDIAKKMNMSRQRVNRIIRDCAEVGIVEINITGLNQSNIELEASLEKKYQLKGVRVIENVIEEDIHKDLGIAAGQYLESIICDGDVVGFSRGRSTSALVDYMPQIRKNNLTVTQLLGSENKDSRHIGVDDIVYRFSEKLQASATMLYAPVIVQDETLKGSIMKEEFFVEAYNVVKACSIAIVGIGTAQSQWKHMTGLYESDMKEQDGWGERVSGEVATHFFDQEGNPVIPPFRERIIAITLEDYFKIPIRIGVAGEITKASAIKAALKGGYINVLVTDLETARILSEQ
ncbi:sugar-binding transcriptional regulator [Lachnospiraceae bacterium LCP25S3_G4]